MIEKQDGIKQKEKPNVKPMVTKVTNTPQQVPQQTPKRNPFNSVPIEKNRKTADRPLEKPNTINQKYHEPEQDKIKFPFLIKTLVTFTKLNSQGNEEKFKDEVVFKLDRPSVKMPWYVLRNYLVPRYLTKKYGPFEVAWQRIYEIKMLKVVNRMNPQEITDIPLRVMTLSQLEAFCKKWELSVPVREFYSVEKAREMVALRQEDPKGFEKHLVEYREGKKRSYPELDGVRKGVDAEDTMVSDENEFKTLTDAEQNKITQSVSRGTFTVDQDAQTTITAEETDALNTDTDPFAGV